MISKRGHNYTTVYVGNTIVTVYVIYKIGISGFSVQTLVSKTNFSISEKVKTVKTKYCRYPLNSFFFSLEVISAAFNAIVILILDLD